MLTSIFSFECVGIQLHSTKENIYLKIYLHLWQMLYSCCLNAYVYRGLTIL